MATPQTQPAKVGYTELLRTRATQLAKQLQALPPEAVADVLYEAIHSTALQSWNNGRSAGRAQALAQANTERRKPGIGHFMREEQKVFRIVFLQITPRRSTE